MKSAPHTAARFNFPAEAEGHVPEKPEKPAAESCQAELCPYCQRTLAGSGSSVGLLRLGVKQLVGAIYMIGAGILRCLRFALAGLLCLIGLIGPCCFGLASWIAHRDDRKLLFPRKSLDRTP